MARCSTCTAPLPPHCGVCDYCGAKNDVDLKGIHTYTVTKPESTRSCPDCGIPLQTIDLQVDGRFYIERCEKCLGLFFDPGELEALLDKSVANVFSIDWKRIDSLVRTRRLDQEPVAYRRCPVCREWMHRFNFGSRSGVVVDQCKPHGVWLDSGELKRLLAWRKAGGQLLHESILQRTEEERQRKERLRAYRETGSLSAVDGSFSSSSSADPDIRLIQALRKIFGKLLR